MPTRPDLRIGSLCTGYGGLDLATEATFGARTAWTADNDPAAAKIINHRFPDAPQQAHAAISHQIGGLP